MFRKRPIRWLQLLLRLQVLRLDEKKLWGVNLGGGVKKACKEEKLQPIVQQLLPGQRVTVIEQIQMSTELDDDEEENSCEVDRDADNSLPDIVLDRC